MLRKWIGVGLLAVCWGQAATSSAQEIPTPIGSARQPDPLPLQPSIGPDGKPLKAPLTPELVQGPISPEAAPPGPADELGLPSGHTSAFQAENFVTTPHLFVHAGAMFLIRQSLGNSSLVYVDTQRAEDGELNQLPTNIGNVQTVLGPGDIHTSLSFGIQGTIGFLGEGWAIEANGFYLPDNSDRANIFLEQRLNAFFQAPADLNALTGNIVDANGNTVANDIFLQGDTAAVTLQSSLGNLEINYRYFPRNMTSCEPLIGVRWLNLSERFTFVFGDDTLTSVNPLGQPNQSSIAIVSSKMVNNFLGPQLGFENQLSICKGIALGLTMKSAVGIDYADMDYTLANANGTYTRIRQRTTRRVGFVQEANLYLDAYYLERLRWRAGYRALYLQNFPEAVDQIDLDLNRTEGRNDNTSSIFFHGAFLELQLLF